MSVRQPGEIQECTFRTSLNIPSPASLTRAVGSLIKLDLPNAGATAVEPAGMLTSPLVRTQPDDQSRSWVWPRFKTLRKTESAQRFLNGLTVVYNAFPTDGAAGGSVPCRLAQVELPFDSWLDVVKMGEAASWWRGRPPKGGA